MFVAMLFFLSQKIGIYYYVLKAWIYDFRMWGNDLKKRLKPNKDNIDIQIGLELIDQEILNAIPDGKTIASLLTNIS
ncbi:hypothetical protein [Candidatus Coxiella mudrowiae]|uniref:hypothetical protein n=1 Tax=Candidatus Coxiella mudrowiae TaxID=2054173 RepID=UPI0006629C7A|nr:hypothetical protein [Candidatus Coxiella mudrowiae]